MEQLPYSTLVPGEVAPCVRSYLYYDDVTIIENNRQLQVHANVGTALVAIFRISLVAKKDIWFHAIA